MGIFKKKKADNIINQYIDKDLMKKMLDYNQDNIVDVNDITCLSEDIEKSFAKYNSLLNRQLDEVKKDSL